MQRAWRLDAAGRLSLVVMCAFIGGVYGQSPVFVEAIARAPSAK
ncbi:hypothetical protein COLINT_03130 [Collinsella intestinalis DSM 13280]|uniref:Uncharacterized protein n=1 Tax=Collinsella intestinalis DSM 13280 TaxID=521003 RepID=C4FAN5_9ACTN|nr:hypothetical protein COLINT_03130 [Collinsella intestinalis DSM 13280]